MKNIDLTELPLEVLDYITRLRKEAAHSRIQRNGARAEADRLRAELESRGECNECHCQIAADAAEIAKGNCPRSGAPVGSRGQCLPERACSQCPLNCNR